MYSNFTNNVWGILSANKGKATRKNEKHSIVVGDLIA
jgi:hypothetical protein